MQTIFYHFRKFPVTIIFLLLISAGGAQAATFTVSNINNTGAGSLRQAVLDSNAAAGSDSIVFDSTFNTPQTITLASAITINPATGDSLTITGPGAGLLSISGGGAVGIFIVSTGDTVSISGLTLTLANGGAISNSGNLTVTGSVFSSNTDGNGGAISNGGAALTVTGCTFTNNTATSGSATGLGGGAIYSNATTIVTISDSMFTGNQEIGGSGGGGAIRNRGGTMNISNSTFTGNSAVSGGGAIQNISVMTVAGSTFTGNTTSGNGGGVSDTGAGQLSISDSVFDGNSAAGSGGGIYYQPNTAGAFLVMTNSTVSNNRANSDNNTTGEGGGLFITGTGSATVGGTTVSGNTANGNASGAGNGGGIDVSAPLTLTNSTVSGNNAGRNGGGIIATGTSAVIVTIESSTIVNNTAATDGGGLVRGSTTNPVNLRNTLIANNLDDGTAPDVFGSVVSGGFNLIRNTTGATVTGTTTGNLTNVDPRLDGVLRDNGGATKTHALRRTSPAVNAADPANFPATDQRGNPRPGTGSNAPDIGAYERQSNDAVVPAAFDFDEDGRADLSIFRPVVDPQISDFFIRRSSDNALQTFSWGLPGDRLAPADYDGDGKTDIAVWRAGVQSRFYIYEGATDTVRLDDFGITGDILTVGDWDGDNKADPAVYRGAAQSVFYYRGSSENPSGATTYYPFGTTGDVPVRGDFDGDKKSDAAVYRASDNTWYIRQSSDGAVRYENWGLSTDLFVPADYDRDGKTDLAVYRNGVWYIRQSSTGQVRYEYFGLSTDVPVPADYDGDGRADPAVFRDGVWYIKQSLNGSVLVTQFGASGDISVPSAYLNP